MVTIHTSANYVGDASHYEPIKQLCSSLSWHPTVHTLYVAHGWHSGHEMRMVCTPDGSMHQVMMEVWYCGYCVNVDGSAKVRYYAA